MAMPVTCLTRNERYGAGLVLVRGLLIALVLAAAVLGAVVLFAYRNRTVAPAKLRSWHAKWVSKQLVPSERITSSSR